MPRQKSDRARKSRTQVQMPVSCAIAYLQVHSIVTVQLFHLRCQGGVTVFVMSSWTCQSMLQHAQHHSAMSRQQHVALSLLRRRCFRASARGAGLRQHPAARRSPLRCHASLSPEGQSPNESGPPPVPANSSTPSGFTSLEKLVTSQAVQRTEAGGRTDWLEVEGCWVLKPPPEAGRPRAVAMFCGGAFAGAAPQLTYRLLLECLTRRNILVVAVPYSTGFNHTRIADEVQYKFDRCMASLGRHLDTADAPTLPVYGIGHSLGSLVQLLISVRYASQRAGNVLISFNNTPLDDVPLIAPFLGPASRVVGPLLSQISTSPARSALVNALEGLRRTSPSLVQQFLPVLDQLEPIFSSLSNGTAEFVPHPEETAEQLRTQYGVPRNLIIQFSSDTIDESPRLNSVLEANSTVARELRYKVLPGDHTRPLLQTVGDVPPELRQAASAVQSQGEDFLDRLSGAAVQAGFGQASQSLNDFAKGITNLGTVLNGSLSSTNEAVTAEMQSLADEIADWMADSLVLQPLPSLPAAGDTTT